jgi:Domain of unknown function (DUF4190)
MTTGPNDPYGQPPPPYQPPAPPPQPAYGQPSYPAYGAPGYPVPGYAATPPNEGLAVAAMVVGIVALVLSCAYGVGLLGSPVAMVLGRVSMKRIDASNGQRGGRGMAQAGFVLGIIGTVLLVLAIIAVVVLVIAAANGSFDETTY